MTEENCNCEQSCRLIIDIQQNLKVLYMIECGDIGPGSPILKDKIIESEEVLDKYGYKENVK